jgi:spore coat polysaccharide biosynthesis protein SpsF
MNIIAIIQARTSSKRLPKKVFLPLNDKPLIWHVFNRMSFSKKISGYILATTDNTSDDELEIWAKGEGIPCFRGSEDDVLSRFYYAALQAKADVIVRVTADDPFKDPAIIDEVIELLTEKDLDFSYNNYPPSYPEGLDVEVFRFRALEKAQQLSEDAFEREHVTQFFYRNPSMFTQANLSYEKNVSHLRWTLDTEEDYQMTKKIYDHLYQNGRIFLFKQILSLLVTYPEIALMNRDVKRSSMYT